MAQKELGESVNPVGLIAKKRDGETLFEEEIDFLIRAFAKGEISDYQMAALLMSVYFQGLSPQELSSWTRGMIASGSTLDLSDLKEPKIDKHSTGGVGDKTSLILVPLAAALGLKVPMVCGRALGFTGGTIDKLESIPGFRVDLSLSEAKSILRNVGGVMMAQSSEIAPADKKIYALRDVTATVESIPLIASSIVSKKAAEGIDGVVFDVKSGDGAFFISKPQATLLAKTLVDLSRRMKLKAVAVLSSMDQPLGYTVGNAVEVAEALELMRPVPSKIEKGGGPQDLKHLTLDLAGWMLLLAGKVRSHQEGCRSASQALEKGWALKKFREMIEAQGGDSRIVEDPSRLPQPKLKISLLAPRAGFLSRIHTRRLGEFLRTLGAGRLRLGEAIDPAVGMVFAKKIGASVKRGELIAVLHAGSVSLENMEGEALSLFEISRTKPRPIPLIHRVIR
jgi:pyrimidine-nucleoside phosphorylase